LGQAIKPCSKLKRIMSTKNTPDPFDAIDTTEKQDDGILVTGFEIDFYLPSERYSEEHVKKIDRDVHFVLFSKGAEEHLITVRDYNGSSAKLKYYCCECNKSLGKKGLNAHRESETHVNRVSWVKYRFLLQKTN